MKSHFRTHISLDLKWESNNCFSVICVAIRRWLPKYSPEFRICQLKQKNSCRHQSYVVFSILSLWRFLSLLIYEDQNSGVSLGKFSKTVETKVKKRMIILTQMKTKCLILDISNDFQLRQDDWYNISWQIT